MSDDTKRGTYGDGTIRTRKDGTLEKRISLGYGPDGRRRRISVYARNLKELQANARKGGGLTCRASAPATRRQSQTPSPSSTLQ